MNIFYIYLEFFHCYYITHYNVSKTISLKKEIVVSKTLCFIVTMEEVQINVSDGTRVEPLSKMYMIQ
jgi:hypothetical protein